MLLFSNKFLKLMSTDRYKALLWYVEQQFLVASLQDKLDIAELPENAGRGGILWSHLLGSCTCVFHS